MSKIDDLKFAAELPSWMEPLAQRISDLNRADLQANTKALIEIHSQLTALIEVQVIFLETIQRVDSEK